MTIYRRNFRDVRAKEELELLVANSLAVLRVSQQVMGAGYGQNESSLLAHGLRFGCRGFDSCQRNWPDYFAAGIFSHERTENPECQQADNGFSTAHTRRPG